MLITIQSSHLCICDRPCISQPIIFCVDFAFFLAVCIFFENLVQLSRCVVKIRLLLCPIERKHTLSKWTNLYT